jgi:hypothetical protein
MALGFGVAARLVMRLIALSAGGGGSFSVGGSLEVVAFGAILAAVLALATELLRKWIPRRWLGSAIAVAAFGIFALLPPPAARSALATAPESGPLAFALFALLFLAYGVLLDRLPKARR